jgi:hypothetical protein
VTDTARDARGIPITEGATCIYGAPVGRSIALVEGVIDGFTPSGRVWVKVVRRAYGGWGTERASRVHVGADRLVIVDALPTSDLPTEEEAAERERLRLVDLYRTRLAELEAGAEPRGSWETVDGYRALLAELEDACP